MAYASFMQAVTQLAQLQDITISRLISELNERTTPSSVSLRVRRSIGISYLLQSQSHSYNLNIY